MYKLVLAFLSTVITVTSAAHAGEADVIAATARYAGADVWRISATVRHADTGWDHYADKWEVLGPDGAVLATRVLAHPHVDEQPFTRSLPAARIPSDITVVKIRAHDSVHGYGGKVFILTLSQ